MHHKAVLMTQQEIEEVRDAAIVQHHAMETFLNALPDYHEVYHTDLVPFVPNPKQVTETERV